MQGILMKCRYLVLIAVAGLLIASASAFVLGFVKTVSAVVGLLDASAQAGKPAVVFIHIMDVFLIATALLIFAIGLFELFIQPVDMPDWLLITNLDQLKSKLANIIILVMAVTFLEHLAEWRAPLETLYFGLAIAVVSAVLISFSRSGKE